MGFVRKNLGVDISGGGARRAAERASANSAEAGRNAADMLGQAAAPFAKLGAEAGGLLSQFINNPGAYSQDLVNDPFFQQLSQQQDESTLAGRAALGLVGSGGTQDALKRNILSLGNQFQQQRFNNLFNTTQMGANAAIGSATGQGNILQNVANAENVGIQAKSQQQARLGGQILGLAGTIGGAAFGGGLGGLFGGAAASSVAPQAGPISGVGTGFFGSGAIPSSLPQY